MRKKKVWRYWCEYCGKGGCGKWQMAVHEKHCTANPNRVCRMCGYARTSPEKLAEAVALLPNPEQRKLNEALEGAMPEVRRLVDNCPACILSALRQKGKGYLYPESFNYKEEVEQMWYSRTED